MMRRTRLVTRKRLQAKTPLERKTPLAQVSVKKAAKAAALKGFARPRATGPDRNTTDGALERDQHSCAVCGDSLFGTRGRDWSLQHRRPRRAGGDPRPDVNLPSNLIPVHGSGTTSCHGRIESYRTEAYENGWLLHASDVPSQNAVNHAVHGWCYLTDDGQISLAPPPVLIGEVIR